MRIGDIFKGTSLQTNQSSLVRENETEEVQKKKQAQGEANQSGEDNVQISDLARQLAQLKKILGEDQTSQQSRLQSLKEQIEAGTYSVSSQELAQSLIAFAQDRE